MRGPSLRRPGLGEACAGIGVDRCRRKPFGDDRRRKSALFPAYGLSEARARLGRRSSKVFAGNRNSFLPQQKRFGFPAKLSPIPGLPRPAFGEGFCGKKKLFSFTAKSLRISRTIVAEPRPTLARAAQRPYAGNEALLSRRSTPSGFSRLRSTPIPAQASPRPGLRRLGPRKGRTPRLERF